MVRYLVSFKLPRCLVLASNDWEVYHSLKTVSLYLQLEPRIQLIEDVIELMDELASIAEMLRWFPFYYGAAVVLSSLVIVEMLVIFQSE